MPVAPVVMVSHETGLVLVQAQVLPDAVTVPEKEPPAADGVWENGDTVNVHGAAAACVTVKACPAIVMVPVRDLVRVFAATEYATEPAAVPDAPLVIVSQELLEDAVQLQPVPEVTLTVPVDAVSGTLADVDERVKLQGAAPWLMLTVVPATFNVPVRVVVLVFAATEYPTTPLPLPLAPLPIVIQPALLDAVQAQPAPLNTEMEAVVPAATTPVTLVGLTL